MQSDANMPVFDAIVRQASEGDYFRRNFCDSAGALRPSKRQQVMAAVTVHYDYQRSKWNESKLGIEVQKMIALEKKYRARKDRVSLLFFFFFTYVIFPLFRSSPEDLHSTKHTKKVRPMNCALIKSTWPSLHLSVCQKRKMVIWRTMLLSTSGW